VSEADARQLHVFKLEEHRLYELLKLPYPRQVHVGRKMRPGENEGLHILKLLSARELVLVRLVEGPLVTRPVEEPVEDGGVQLHAVLTVIALHDRKVDRLALQPLPVGGHQRVGLDSIPLRLEEVLGLPPAQCLGGEL